MLNTLGIVMSVQQKKMTKLTNNFQIEPKVSKFLTEIFTNQLIGQNFQYFTRKILIFAFAFGKA